jgi:hypothetical protein
MTGDPFAETLQQLITDFLEKREIARVAIDESKQADNAAAIARDKMNEAVASKLLIKEKLRVLLESENS